MVDVEHLAVAVEIGNVGDLVARQAMFYAAMPGLLRRGMDRPEVAGEVDLLVVGKSLVVEDDDRIAVDGGRDGVVVGGGKRLGEVDAGHFAHEQGMQLLDGDAHERLLRL